MSEAAREALNQWGSGLVSLSRTGSGPCELVLRLHGAGSPARAGTHVVLELERDGHWWIENITHAELSAHRLVLHHGDKQQTTIARLLLPPRLERALHVGQFATRALDLPTVATPFSTSWTPGPTRHRPRDVIVWADSATRSRLALWWVCASFPGAAIWVVPLPPGDVGAENSAAIRPVSHLLAATPDLRRLAPRESRAFATNWKAWARGELQFRDVALAKWPASMTWLGEVPPGLFDLAPRFDDGPHLSAYDLELLRQCDHEWSTTLGVLQRLQRGPHATFLQIWGDLTLRKRLQTWSRWQRGRFVQRRVSRADRPFTGEEFLLTDEGRALLTALPTLDSAPPFAHGAFRFYTPNSWVVGPRGPQGAPRSSFTARR